MARSAVLVLSVYVAFFLGSAHGAPKESKYVSGKSSFEKLPAQPKGGTLYDSLGGNPKVINPLLRTDNNSFLTEKYLWLYLMDQDPDTLKFIPALAESLTISADKKSYTFVLNAAAKWQDGTPVTTEDVKFTFDTMMDPKSNTAVRRVYYEGVKLTIKDARTFTFFVPEPKFFTLEFMCTFRTLNKKQYENEKDFNSAKAVMQPIGNGPYKLTVFQRDQRLEFERVKDWWGDQVPNLKNRWNYDKVVLRLITDPSLLYERFLKGEVDLMTFAGPGLETFVQKARGSDKAKIGTSPKDGKDLWADEFKNKAPRGYDYIGWNLRNPMFASVKTRKALAHLIDVASIIEKVKFGYAIPSTSPFGSLTANSAPELRKAGKLITYDLKKAMALLKEDGWADSNGDNILDKKINGQQVDFKFTLKYNSNNPARGKIAQILKENYKKAGIEVTIRAMEWNAYLDDIYKRQFDAIVMAWTGVVVPNAKQIWHSSSEANQGSNAVGYNNPKVDALIDKSNLELDPKKRPALMQEINRLIYEDQPYAFLTEPRSLVAGFNKKLKSSRWVMDYSVEPPTDIYSIAP